MEITRINVYPVNGKIIKANGTIGFNDMFVVSFKIMEGEHGLFVQFPSHSYEGEDGKKKYVNDFYIMDGDFREDVSDAIMKAYEDETEDNKKETRSKGSRRR